MGKVIRHRSPDSIWLFDFPALEEMDDCAELQVWLSERDVQLILQGMKDVHRFQSRVFVEAEGNSYTTVDATQFEAFQGWVSDMFNNLGGYQMCNEIMQGILEALQAIADRECCPTGSPGSGLLNSGSRGSAISSQSPNSFEEEGETPPPGFDTWAEYRQHKCDVAHDIVKNFKVDLLSLSNLIPEDDAFSTIMVWLVGVLLTPVPYDDLATLIGLLLAASVEYSWLAELSSEVQDNADDLVCTLYTSSDSANAESSYLVALEGLIDGLDIPGFGQDWLKNVADSMLTPDVTNKLFVPGPTESQGADCPCASACTLISADDIAGTGGVTFELDSGSLTTPGSASLSSVQMDWGGNPETPTQIIVLQATECCVRFLDATSSELADIRYWTEADAAGCGDDVGFAVNGLPDDTVCFNRIYIGRQDLANSPSFSIDIVWESGCEV